ncbi:MAG: MlaD family protein [Waddliaceae bacterium]
MRDSMKNLMIGLFVLAALAIITFLILFLRPFVGDEGQTVIVRFADIDKVNVGTRVLYAGKPVGEVIRITPIDRKRHGVERKSDVYVYELLLSVDSSVRIYNSDIISLRTSGLLGEKSVSINPEPLKPGQELRLVNQEVIYAELVGSVEDTFQDLQNLGYKAEALLDLAIDALKKLEQDKVWDNISISVQNIKEISSSLVESRNGELPPVVALKNMIANLEQVSNNFLEVSTNLKSGRGTLGRLFGNEDLYLQAKAVFAKGETVMDDITHYGLLFHTDNGWKRLRARRMNLVRTLRSPEQFRNFFNDEVNQISTSIARVTQVMEQTSCYDLSQDCQFVNVFGDLLRRIENLEESVQMYNMQLRDCPVDECAMGGGCIR